MPKLWGPPLASVFLVALAGLILWPMLGAVGALLGLTLLLLVLLLHHIRNLSLLHDWLVAKGLPAVPDGSGAWEEVFAGLARLVRRQTQIESRLSAALDRFRQAAAALPEGVIILDEGDRIEWCNPRAEAHFALDSQRDRGQLLTYLLRNPQFVEYLETRNFSEPLALRLTRNDTELVLSIQLVPYGGSDKLLLSRDISRWERMETTRRDFVANVSHELRTPLTVLNGFLETLADLPKPDPELTRRSVTLMAEQTVRMNRLVEDLLTLSRLEGTNTPLREEEVDVPQLCHALLRDAVALSAGRHKVTLQLSSDSGLLGSADELRSAFTNLISNAVRYTPHGGEIELSWSNRGGESVFSVRDTGIGIEPHHIPRLTERFYRVDRSRSRATGGTGLGLAIVKHVLSRHQAHLLVTSELGRGSIFSAVFPAARRRPLAGATARPNRATQIG